MQSVEQLLYLQGIGQQYTGYNTEKIIISNDVRRCFLTACGYNLDDSASINEANFQLDVAPWFKIINPTSFISSCDFLLKLRVNESQLNSRITCQIYQNTQHVIEHIVDISTLKEIGNYHYNNECFREIVLKITSLEIGYYQINVAIDDIHQSGDLIVYPEKAYQSIDNKVWGVSLQLYSLRGDDNYGIGDFNDLRQTIMYSSKRGADFILINPLHALFDDDPERASPYSPSDCLFLNPLYIHIQDIPDFEHCADAQTLLKSHLLSSDLKKHKNDVYINYQFITTYKYHVFYLLFNHFIKQHCAAKTAYFKLFTDFKTDHGVSIKQYCEWVCALDNIDSNYKILILLLIYNGKRSYSLSNVSNIQSSAI